MNPEGQGEGVRGHANPLIARCLDLCTTPLAWQPLDSARW